MSADCKLEPDNDENNSRPRSSKEASGLCKWGPSKGLSAGSAPKKLGVKDKTLESLIV